MLIQNVLEDFDQNVLRSLIPCVPRSDPRPTPANQSEVYAKNSTQNVIQNDDPKCKPKFFSLRDPASAIQMLSY